MESLTLTFAVIAVILVILMPLRWGFLVYLATILYYPDYLRIIVGGFTLSAGRIVVVVLLMRCLLDRKLRYCFRWSRLDTLVIIADLIYVIFLSISANTTSAAIKFRCGAMMDTTFAYFATRFIINNVQQVTFLVKGVVVLLIPLALLGAHEASTATSPYDGLLEHRFYAEKWTGAKKFEYNEKGHGGEARSGFFRAQGPHCHTIIFGLSFVVFLPLVWKTLCNSKWCRFRSMACAALAVGALSSMSSGPLIGLIFVGAGLAIEPIKKYIKLLFILFIVMCIYLEFWTDRPHFYHVFASHLAFDEGTAYARTRLLDVAIERLPEYWLTGYGGNDPGWGPYVTGMDYTDVCVHYIALAVMYGLVGLLAYLAVILTAGVRLWRCHGQSNAPCYRDIVWGLLVSLMAILGGHLSISAFGALDPLYSIVFGLIGSVTCLKMTPWMSTQAKGQCSPVGMAFQGQMGTINCQT
jgi:hypothetical protein